MVEITKRALLGAAALTTASVGAARAAPASPFVTRSRGVFNGVAVDYVATVDETVIPGPDGQPIARFVATAYVKADADPATRPVLFAFNGGPSSSSATLHMMALGPRRIAVSQDPAHPATSGVVDNLDTVLDAADLVFIDPAETGFSRVVAPGRTSWFYSVEGDARSVSDFVVAWTRANRREASPKFVLGESYGTLRAALMAGQLADVMPLDGVFLFGQAVNMIETSQRAKNVLAYATNLPALCAIAAYHGRAPAWRETPVSAIVNQSYAWGMGEYLQALLQGHDLPAARRHAIADRLEAMTGIGAAYYLANDLQITKVAFLRELMRSEGQILGMYDARYVGPGPAAGERAADPFAPVLASIQPAMLAHYAEVLNVTLPSADYRSTAPDTGSWAWNGTLGPGGPFLDYDYQARVGPAFAANPKFRLMIGTGVYDLTTTVGPARYMVTKSDWPRDRVIQREYLGGHMAYTHEPTLKAFTADIRAWITGARLAPRPL